MSVTADPITVRKIALAKQLFQHAVTQAAHDTPTARMLSVMSFDLATETILRAAVVSLDPTRTPADGFAGLVQQVELLLDKASLGPLPDRGNVLHVHSIRNDVQHRARHPSPTEVSDSRTYTRDFLCKLAEAVWKVSIDAVSLADLVGHPKLRELLQDAERQFQSHQFVRTAEQACTAVTLAYQYVENSIVGRIPGFVGGLAMHDSWGKPASDHDSREMFRAFERMRDTLLISALGLSYADQARFRQLAGSVYFTMDGKAHPNGAKEGLSEAEAEFVLAYAVAAVQQIETIVGDVERPFGSERW